MQGIPHILIMQWTVLNLVPDLVASIYQDPLRDYRT